jgi:hypothetical protein
LFDVSLSFPTFVAGSATAGQKTNFLCKAAQLPGSTLGLAPLFYFGRESKFAGNRTFPDWTIQIINDEDFVIRSAFEAWFSAINDPTNNVRNPAALVLDGGYAVDAQVTAYSKDGSIATTYTLQAIWPMDLAPIEVDWQSNDTISEFSVTLAVNSILSAGAGDQ